MKGSASGCLATCPLPSEEVPDHGATSSVSTQVPCWDDRQGTKGQRCGGRREEPGGQQVPRSPNSSPVSSLGALISSLILAGPRSWVFRQTAAPQPQDFQGLAGQTQQAETPHLLPRQTGPCPPSSENTKHSPAPPALLAFVK